MQWLVVFSGSPVPRTDVRTLMHSGEILSTGDTQGNILLGHRCVSSFIGWVPNPWAMDQHGSVAC